MKYLELLGDAYKYAHKDFYDKGVTNIYSNLVPRKFRFFESFDEKIAVFGNKILAHELDKLAKEFFSREDVPGAYDLIVKGEKLLTKNDWNSLRNKYKDSGKLPLLIKGVKEGSLVDVQTPVLHVEVTDPEFFWLGQYLETFISQTYWPAITAATKSRELSAWMQFYTYSTSDSKDNFWRLHDFGCRGHVGVEASQLMGAGHLQYCSGSDSIAAQTYLHEVYGKKDFPNIVNATEHSIMCSYGEEKENNLIGKILKDYEDMLVSIVIDGFDQDKFIYETVPSFKETIIKRKMPLVLRPDSGEMEETLMKYIKFLDKTFGHTVNSKGYKIVNHINLLWGDGCTDENIDKTLETAMMEGYSVDNFIFGVGAYYYQSSTRDTLSIAIKATAVEKDGKILNTMKKVKSDKSKASLSGLCAVDEDLNVIQDIKTYEEFEKIDKREVIYNGAINN